MNPVIPFKITPAAIELAAEHALTYHELEQVALQHIRTSSEGKTSTMSMSIFTYPLVDVEKLDPNTFEAAAAFIITLKDTSDIGHYYSLDRARLAKFTLDHGPYTGKTAVIPVPFSSTEEEVAENEFVEQIMSTLSFVDQIMSTKS